MIHDRITVDPKIMFGKPVIKGTRVPVELILRKMAEGMTDSEILIHHPHLTVEDIRAAAAFAADLCRAAGVVPGADLVAEVQAGRIILGPAAPSLAERIVARARALPQETLDRLPADGASQHDHYIYGTPKRPE